MKAKGEKKGYKAALRSAMLEMDLPAHAIFDMPRIEMNANEQFFISRHHGLLAYAQDSIVIAAKEMNVKINGEQLTLRVMNEEEISIGGKIHAIEFMQKERGQ